MVGSPDPDEFDEDEDLDEYESLPSQPLDKSYLSRKAPVVVAKIPADLERNAALEILARVRKLTGQIDALWDELMTGPLKKKLRSVGAEWAKYVEELGAVEV
jgi:hypothetical protein